MTAKKLQYDTLKQQLADNETHKALEAQEGKLRQIQKSRRAAGGRLRAELLAKKGASRRMQRPAELVPIPTDP